MSHSAAHFPVEPLIFCRAIKERGRSLKGQVRRMCRNMPKLLYPVEKCSSQFSVNTMMRKSLPFIPAHITHFSRLSHRKTHTRAAPGWKIQSLSPHSMFPWFHSTWDFLQDLSIQLLSPMARECCVRCARPLVNLKFLIWPRSSGLF